MAEEAEAGKPNEVKDATTATAQKMEGTGEILVVNGAWVLNVTYDKFCYRVEIVIDCPRPEGCVKLNWLKPHGLCFLMLGVRD